MMSIKLVFQIGCLTGIVSVLFLAVKYIDVHGHLKTKKPAFC